MGGTSSVCVRLPEGPLSTRRWRGTNSSGHLSSKDQSGGSQLDIQRIHSHMYM